MRHLLSAGDLDAATACLILDTAAELATVTDRSVKKLPTLRGRTVVNLFYEDSTRTRISFEMAAKRLSADVINFAAKGSSVSKGESLPDTIRTLECYADVIVLRHPETGSAAIAAKAARVATGSSGRPSSNGMVPGGAFVRRTNQRSASRVAVFSVGLTRL